MDFNEYQIAAFRTAKRMPSLAEDLNHAVIGIHTEGGEVATEVKRALVYDAPITEDMVKHIVEELGDLLWYVALASTCLNISLSDIAERNVAKLKKRFPEKYSNEAAEARADKGGLDARSS